MNVFRDVKAKLTDMKKDQKQTKWPSSVRKKKCLKNTGLPILARLTRINKKDQKHSYLLSILVKKIDILSSQRNRQPNSQIFLCTIAK